MVLRPKPLASPPRELAPQTQRVLALVDGLRPLRDIVAQSKLVEFEAYEALHHLLDLGVIEISLSAAPLPKVTPIAADRPAADAVPTTPAAVVLGIAALILVGSLSIGLWVAPAFLARVERTTTTVVASPAEIATVDEAARVSLALETYRRVRGSYPKDLPTLALEGFLPARIARSASERYSYQSDGATYTRVLR